MNPIEAFYANANAEYYEEVAASQASMNEEELHEEEL